MLIKELRGRGYSKDDFKLVVKFDSIDSSAGGTLCLIENKLLYQANVEVEKRQKIGSALKVAQLVIEAKLQERDDRIDVEDALIDS